MSWRLKRVTVHRIIRRVFQVTPVCIDDWRVTGMTRRIQLLIRSSSSFRSAIRFSKGGGSTKNISRISR